MVELPYIALELVADRCKLGLFIRDIVPTPSANEGMASKSPYTAKAPVPLVAQIECPPDICAETLPIILGNPAAKIASESPPLIKF